MVKMGPVIFVNDVLVGFTPQESALFHVDNVCLGNDGKVVCVLGPTGCGKSTFIKLLAGLLPGSYFTGTCRACRQSMSYLPQTPIVFPEFDAFTNALYLASLRHYRNEE